MGTSKTSKIDAEIKSLAKKESPKLKDYLVGTTWTARNHKITFLDPKRIRYTEINIKTAIVTYKIINDKSILMGRCFRLHI